MYQQEADIYGYENYVWQIKPQDSVQYFHYGGSAELTMPKNDSGELII